MRFSPRVYTLAVAIAMVLTVACNKAPNDAQISSDIQAKLASDSGLQNKQLNIQADKGIVTLSGTVDNDGQRDAASRYASSEAGVKQVVNNLQVAPPAPTETAATEPPPPVVATPAPEEKPKPSRPKRRQPSRSNSDADTRDYSNTNDNTATNSAPTSMAQNSPPAPVTPPAPVVPPPPQKVTIPSGTSLSVRLVDAISSQTATQGQSFQGTLNSPLAVDGEVVVPAGYNVEGHVVAVQSAGKFTGKSQLTLQLDRISVGGKYYNIQTDEYKREGSSRGKNTAEKVGAGAAIGAIIGGIAGGGKGAGIGAAAGGGLGGGVQAATKGQQINLPSEMVLNFTLQSPVTVTPTTKGPHTKQTPQFDPSQQQQ
jgi:outer membrane biosynthesis protein TonB